MSILLATTTLCTGALRAKHAAAIPAAARWAMPIKVAVIAVVKPVTFMVTKAALRS